MQKPGKSGRTRGLVDMSIQPEDSAYQYQRPENAELMVDAPVCLGEGPNHNLYVKMWMYRNYVVDFALTHTYRLGDDSHAHVARYDCCHSEVHKHQYSRNGDELSRTVQERISNRQTAWETVDRWYEPCYDDMIDNWHEHHRRWSE